jgi:hypothetical protein
MGFYKVVVCECGALFSHEEVKEYSRCDYEAEKMLSIEDLQKAIKEGNVVPSKIGCCDVCCGQDLHENNEN